MKRNEEHQTLETWVFEGFCIFFLQLGNLSGHQLVHTAAGLFLCSAGVDDHTASVPILTSLDKLFKELSPQLLGFFGLVAWPQTEPTGYISRLRNKHRPSETSLALRRSFGFPQASL